MNHKWVIIFILWILLIILILGTRTASKEYPNSLDSVVMSDSDGFPAKAPLQDWIEGLVLAESEGRSDIKILDVNNKFSYSCLQFQEATFRQEVERFNLLPYAEPAEVKNFIYDCDFQKELARLMLEDNYNNWKHWYLSTTQKVGYPPKEN